MDQFFIAFIEELAANAWPSEIEQPLGGWRFRYTQGVTRRGNSVLPLNEDQQIGLEEKIKIAEEFYSRWELPTVFQMNNAAQPETLVETLILSGYSDDYHTQVQTVPLKTMLKNTKVPSDFSVVMEPQLFNTWFDLYYQASEFDEHEAKVRGEILNRIKTDSCYILLKDGNLPVGVGLGVAERGYMGIYCMVTLKEYRRERVATQLLHTLAKWGKKQDVTEVYLQVMENNPPAFALYQKAGFESKYRYWYMEKPYGQEPEPKYDEPKTSILF